MSGDPLAAVRDRLSEAVLALDYDGTLAPVVDDPAAAVPEPGAVEVLRALATRVRTLALVTGRPADLVVELAGLQDVPGLVVLGQYGVQRWSGGLLSAPPPVPGLALARTELAALVAAEGADLEDKGLSLVVHVRRAPAGAAERLTGPVAEVAARAGLEVHPGRQVVELRPPGFDKGGALRSLCEPAPGALLVAGDDLGDLPAFAVARELGGVSVCSGSEEGPAELRQAADVVVDGPAGVVALLRSLL